MWVFYPILMIAICIVVEGFFSGAETGFYTINRLRLRSRVEAGSRRAAVLQSLFDQPDRTVMTTLLGTNIMVYMATSLAARLLSFHDRAELLATFIMTPVIFVFGEMIPKDLFRRNADSLMYLLAGPLDAIRFLLTPVTAVLGGIVSAATWKLPREQRGTALSGAALREWIEEGRREGVLTETQLAMSGNVMALLEKKVSAAMLPLAAVKMIDVHLSGAALRAAVKEAAHSRLPVFDAAPDNIIGTLHVLDYLRTEPQGPPLSTILRPVFKVNQTEGVTAVLLALQRQRLHLAVVVDDAQKAVGIVTVKDLVEEVVGELQDF